MLNRIRVPAELKHTPPSVLEEYVRQRILQYASLFSQRLNHYAPGLAKETLERAAVEANTLLPPGDHGQLSLEDKQLQLVFRHDCLALGCLDPQCPLCTHNPSRRCTVNFDRKYLVNDMLKARCGAGIRVELIDPLTAQPVEEKLPEITLQISVLDGNLYDNKFLDSGKQYEGGMEPAEELDACALLQNKKKSTPLLVCGSGGANDSAGYVLLSMVDGKVPLNDLHVTDSSEAILSGRKPPFRLLVRAILPPNGPKLNIRHAVSEGFVVATRRTRTAGKADIPSVDDPVSKLEHMGKETVKKLADLASAAEQAGVEIDIPENCVQKVGEFKLLALRADQDGHLRQKLQHVLKLSKEKWDEARDHAMRAVVADNRMRAWYAGRSCELGVLFTARMGNVDLERPVGLLQTRMEGGERKTEAILVAQLNPSQREMLRHMQPQAVAAWWAPGHTGWAIFPMDSDAFLQSGTLAAAPAVPAALATAAVATAEAPSSPTQSAVSLNTMSQSQRRHTGGSGGGDAGGAAVGGAGMSIGGGSQSTEVVLPPDATPQMGKQPGPQPTFPSAPVSLGGGVPLSSLHGAGGLPTAFGLPNAFAAGMPTSGRSSRAGSMTDSPPPSMRMPIPQQQNSINHHHSLPQPPSQQNSLPPHPSLQGMGNQLSQQLPSLQQLSSYHSQASIATHPGMHGPQGLQGHPSLQANSSLQAHSSLQHHSSLSQHPSLQQHPSVQQQHPSQRQGGPQPVGGGRTGSFTGLPGQGPPPLGSMHGLSHPHGGEVGLSGGPMPHTGSASLPPPQHLMPPPPPQPMGPSRSLMMPPPFRAPPPMQQHSMSQHHHGQFRSPSAEPYQQQSPSPMAGHLGPHSDSSPHAFQAGGGHPRANGSASHMHQHQQHQQYPQHPAMQHQQHQHHMQAPQHPSQGRAQQQQGLGSAGHLGDADPGGRMAPPNIGPHGQHGRHQLPLPHAGGRGLEDPATGDLQSRGSANPRPHKMPSLGRNADVNFLFPAPVEVSNRVDGNATARADVCAGAGGNQQSAGGAAPAAAAAAAPHTSAPVEGPAVQVNDSASVPAAIAKETANQASAGSPGAQQARQQFSAPTPGGSVGAGGVQPGPRASPPVPGQSPPGASPPPPGPPPNPFARVQSNRANGTSGGPGVNSDDSDSDDSLDLGSLPLMNSMQPPLGAPSVGGARATQPAGGNANGGGAGPSGGNAGQVPPGGLNAPLPSLQMIDSQQLENMLAENMIYETSSLNTGISGLFLPPAMALPDGIGMLGATFSKELLKPTSSGLLKPTTSGLDTMASMELALPGVRKGDAPAVGQEPKAGGSAGANMAVHAAAPAVGMGVVSNRMLGPYAR